MSFIVNPENFGPEDFQRETGVDDAALEKLKEYATLVEENNEQAGLVGDSTLPHIWHRHFLDSAQIHPLIPKQPGRIADLGSGAGFPGLVLAIMGVPNITLFERNTRKAGFLQETAEALEVKVDILNLTTEEYQGAPFDFITARALAPLGELLDLSRRLRQPSTICLFLKGKNLDEEIKLAQKIWVLDDLRRIASITELGSTLVRLAGASSARGR